MEIAPLWGLLYTTRDRSNKQQSYELAKVGTWSTMDNILNYAIVTQKDKGEAKLSITREENIAKVYEEQEQGARLRDDMEEKKERLEKAFNACVEGERKDALANGRALLLELKQIIDANVDIVGRQLVEHEWSAAEKYLRDYEFGLGQLPCIHVTTNMKSFEKILKSYKSRVHTKRRLPIRQKWIAFQRMTNALYKVNVFNLFLHIVTVEIRLKELQKLGASIRRPIQFIIAQALSVMRGDSYNPTPYISNSLGNTPLPQDDLSPVIQSLLDQLLTQRPHLEPDLRHFIQSMQQSAFAISSQNLTNSLIGNVVVSSSYNGSFSSITSVIETYGLLHQWQLATSPTPLPTFSPSVGLPKN